MAESPGRCFVWNIFIAPVCRGYGQVNDDPPQGSIYLSWVLISPGKCSSLGFFSYFSFTFPFLPKAHLKLPWRVDWQVPKGRNSVCLLSVMSRSPKSLFISKFSFCHFSWSLISCTNYLFLAWEDKEPYLRCFLLLLLMTLLFLLEGLCRDSVWSGSFLISGQYCTCKMQLGRLHQLWNWTSQKLIKQGTRGKDCAVCLHI